MKKISLVSIAFLGLTPLLASPALAAEVRCFAVITADKGSFHAELSRTGDAFAGELNGYSFAATIHADQSIDASIALKDAKVASARNLASPTATRPSVIISYAQDQILNVACYLK